jgi:hypothetical protein
VGVKRDDEEIIQGLLSLVRRVKLLATLVARDPRKSFVMSCFPLASHVSLNNEKTLLKK